METSLSLSIAQDLKSMGSMNGLSLSQNMGIKERSGVNCISVLMVKGLLELLPWRLIKSMIGLAPLIDALDIDYIDDVLADAAYQEWAWKNIRPLIPDLSNNAKARSQETKKLLKSTKA
jgi:hypothetical protein